MINIEVVLGNKEIAVGVVKFKDNIRALSFQHLYAPYLGEGQVPMEYVDKEKSIYIKMPKLESINVIRKALDIIEREMIKDMENGNSTTENPTLESDNENS